LGTREPREVVMDTDPVVVLLSGGQDSTTCLYWALARGATRVLALSMWYGQRHAAELDAARAVVAKAREQYPSAQIDHEELRIGPLLNSTSPLVSGATLGTYARVEDLPGGVEPTFVPGRNLLFLVLAANRAAEYGARVVVTGVCEEDFGGYYDCRRSFVDAMEVAISQGFVGADRWLTIETPLMRLTKRATVDLARTLPGCMDALAVTHTCYAGVVPPCGECHACHLRARGFEQAGVTDPLVARFGGS
jgi:7-cyano-7-deazaguanine synthase